VRGIVAQEATLASIDGAAEEFLDGVERTASGRSGHGRLEIAATAGEQGLRDRMMKGV
jgi:hypothetical protein